VNKFIMELTDRFPAETRPGLRNARFSSDLNLCPCSAQPPDAFKKATQYFAARHLAEQRQGDHVIDHHMGREIPVALAGLASGLKRSFNSVCGEHPGDSAERDVIRDSTPTF
jgi:hypothetical protein